MTILQIRITVLPTPPGFGYTARGFIDELDSLMKKSHGGSCVGVVDGGIITLEARTTAKEELTSLVESYCGALRKEGRTVEIIVIENPATPLNQSALANGVMLNTAPAKLTRAFFTKLPSGTFVASNLFKHAFESVFAETVGPAETRAAQWDRIRAAGADQRACRIFTTEGHYRQWTQQQAEYFSSMRR
jgi:hypothetical protein